MINREIALEILKRGGLEADCAEDGQVAVDIISSAEPDKYDIILMDIQMPVMNGYEATKEIRKLFPDKHVPAAKSAIWLH